MALHRHLNQHGKSATVTNFTETGTDTYNDPTFSESTESTNVIIDRTVTEADINVTEEGQNINVDGYIYCDDEVTLKDGEGGDYPTEITVDSKDYEVMVVDDYGNGIVRCLVKRI